MDPAFGVVAKKRSFPSQRLAVSLYALVAQSVLVKSRAGEGGDSRLRSFGPRSRFQKTWLQRAAKDPLETTTKNADGALRFSRRN